MKFAMMLKCMWIFETQSVCFNDFHLMSVQRPNHRQVCQYFNLYRCLTVSLYQTVLNKHFL